MKTIDVIANIRKDISVLSNKLISSVRPGHVAYVSKVDAGHTLARIEHEIDALMTTLKQSQISEQEWAEGLAKAHGV